VKGWDAATYGDRVADFYDEWVETRDLDTDGAVEFLTGLAGGGPALELAVGTGRVALPLAARGVAVQGVDASEKMVARLRAKPGGDTIPVTIGDFADVAVDGRFSLVFVVFNTFFALLSQDDQVRCFANVAHRLTDDGVFVLEAFFPDVGRFADDQLVTVRDVELDHVRLDVSRHDPVEQRIDAQQVDLRRDGIRLQPISIRYAWPGELDLMARLARLRLRERWGGWQRQPFTAASPLHVSVYERAS
jgi:SAM-dependent methyltransferase